MLSPVSTTRVHGPSWRPVNSGAFFDTRVDGPGWRVSKMHPSWQAINSGAFFDTRVDGPGWRVLKNASELTGRQLGCICDTRTPANPDRQLGCQKCTRVHGPSTRPSTRAVNSGSGNRALLRYNAAMLLLFLLLDIQRTVDGCRHDNRLQLTDTNKTQDSYKIRSAKVFKIWQFLNTILAISVFVSWQKWASRFDSKQ